MFGGGCATRLERRAGPGLGSVDRGAQFLKLHLYSGEAYVLSSWKVDGAGAVISGPGEHWGPDRLHGERAAVYRVSLRDVAMFETNTHTRSPSDGRMVAATGVSLAISVTVLLLIVSIGGGFGNDR